MGKLLNHSFTNMYDAVFKRMNMITKSVVSNLSWLTICSTAVSFLGTSIPNPCGTVNNIKKPYGIRTPTFNTVSVTVCHWTEADPTLLSVPSFHSFPVFQVEIFPSYFPKNFHIHLCQLFAQCFYLSITAPTCFGHSSWSSAWSWYVGAIISK